MNSQRNEASLHSGDLLWIAFCVFLGFALRLLLLFAGHGIVDGDEAIVGLMAKHINEGKPWPIFYYGQPYMGSLEAICAAFSFRILGTNGIALKMVPVFFSLIHIGLVHVLALRLFSRPAARFSSFLTALGPAGLITWSNMARGGFIELVVLGTLSMILAIDILRQKKPNNSRFLVLGLVLGLGWWTNNQMVFYLFALAGVFAVYFLRVFGLLQTLSWGVLTILGFFVGGAPFWYYNIVETPRWQTFEVLTRPQSETSFLSHLQGFFTEALPIIFGARRFWSDTDIFPGSTLMAYLVYAAAFVFLLFETFRGRDLPAAELGSRRAQLWIPLLFLLVVPLVFSASSFGWLSKAPRYLLPLYSVLFVIVGGCLHALMIRRIIAFSIGLSLFSLLLWVHIASNFFGGISVPGQPFVANGDRVAEDHSELYKFLAREHYDHIWTNYWIGYRVAFETLEKVTFSRFGVPRTLRLPQYEADSAMIFEDQVYVLVPSEEGPLGQILHRLGYVYRSQKVGEYVVLDRIKPESAWGEAMKILPAQIKTTSRAEWGGRMVDGDLDSRWGSGMPQQPGMAVEVWFDGLTDVAGLEIDQGKYLSDLPRHLAILGLLEDGTWCEFVDLVGIDPNDLLQTGEYDPTPRVLRVHFAPRKVKALHLEQRDPGKGPFDWSIAEIRVRPPLR